MGPPRRKDRRWRQGIWLDWHAASDGVVNAQGGGGGAKGGVGGGDDHRRDHRDQ